MKRNMLLIGVVIVLLLTGIVVLKQPENIIVTAYEHRKDVNLPVDVVLYPFYLDGQNLNISAYSLDGNNLIKLNKNVDIGYSSVIDINAIAPILKHFDVEDPESLHNVLGQYFSYHNFNGMEVFVFCQWETSPRVLNIIFLHDGEIYLLSGKIGNSFLPIALIKEDMNVYILLRDNKQFILREIDTVTYKTKDYRFDLFSFSSNYFYYVETFINNGNLYLFMNEYSQGNANNENAKFTGGYMATINLETDDIAVNKLCATKFDFVARDEYTIIWGENRNGLLSCEICNYSGTPEKAFNLYVDKANNISPNSAYYNDNLLLVNLTGYSDTREPQGVFLVIDVESQEIAYRWLYKYTGAIYVRYYTRESNRQYEAQYSSAN